MSRRTKSLEFIELQSFWYDRLKKEGFRDIEDTSINARPLKKWSGVSISPLEAAAGSPSKTTSLLDLVISQPEEEAIVSSFPDSVFKAEEAFINHPDFYFVCEHISSLGSRKMAPAVIESVWRLHTEGRSERSIGKEVHLYHATIHRILISFRQWMTIMSKDEDKSTTVVLRLFNPGSDLPFIYSSWRHSLWWNEERDQSQSEAFYRAASRMIKAVLKAPMCRVNIACLSDDSDHIIGYSVMILDHLEWVYVKSDYRNQGIASLLTKGFKTVSEPKTKIGCAIVNDKYLTIKENV